MFFRLLKSFLVFSLSLSCWAAPLSALAETLADRLEEVEIPSLPARTRDALDFLMAHKGFAPQPADEVIHQLQAGRVVVCVVVGGPTQVPISYALQSLADLLRVEAEVKQQHWKDRYRPAYKQAQAIFLTQIPLLQQRLQEQEQQALAQTQQLTAAFKQLNTEQKNLQNNLSEIQHYLNQLLAPFNTQTPLYQQARAAYEPLHRQYQELDKAEQRLTRTLADLGAERPALLQRIQAAWQEVSQAEALSLTDPANMTIYREHIATQRAGALSLEQALRRLDGDVQHNASKQSALHAELAGLKPSYDAATAQFEQVKGPYTQLEDRVGRTQKAYATLAAEAQQVSQQKQENQARQAQWVQITALLRAAQDPLQQVLSIMQISQNYGDYAGHQAQHLLSLKALLSYSQDSLYTGYFGTALAEGLLPPLQHLSEALQKPALPAMMRDFENS